MKKRNLSNLKSPTVIKRSRVRREYTTALRQESAKKAIGDLYHGCEIYGFTKGQWSIIDVIEHCLNQTGPADVFISTWSAAGADIKAVQNFIKNGQILSLKFIVDYSFQSRKPEFCQELQEIFGEDAIRVTVTHAKYVIIRNADWNLVIRTSMNLNFNPRFENFEISDSKEFADFQQTIIDEIWSNQKVAEGFKLGPSGNKKQFKKTFSEQTSLFEKSMADGRDLL